MQQERERKPENAGRKTIRFIVNPVSGTAGKSGVEALIHSRLDDRVFDAEVLFTEAAGHGTELAGRAVADGVDVVVAVGGDGTVNEVAGPLIGTKTAFGLLPAGSGNGLARHLGIPLKLAQAVEVLNAFQTTAIDTVKINDRHFVSIAGVGFDAYVARQFAQAGKRGFWSYLSIVLNTFRSYRPETYELQFEDGQKLQTPAFFISFANSNQFGNNTVIAPGARLDDGKVDVCIVQKPTVSQLPALAYRMLTKQPEKLSLMQTIPAQALKVTGKGEQWVNLDGEAIRMGAQLNIEVVPRSLQMIIPKK